MNTITITAQKNFTRIFTFMTRGQIKLGIENYRGIREINIKPKSVYYSFKNQPEVNKMNQQNFVVSVTGKGMQSTKTLQIAIVSIAIV